MNDGAFSRLLDRESAARRVEASVEAGLPLLTDAIDQATWLLQRCRVSAAQGSRSERQPYSDASNAPLVLYLHIIEMVDATSALLAAACVEPAVLQQRSLFEGVLSLKFIVAREDEFERRGLAWMVHHARNRIRWAELTDASTKRGKQFAEVWEREKGTTWPLQDETTEADELRAYLREPHVAPLNEEFEALSKKRKGGPVPWYQLFRVGSVRDLAREVELEAEYISFYPLFSGVTHAGDLTRFLSQSDEGDLEPLRRTDNFVRIYGLCLRLLEYGTQAVAGFFRPMEPLSQIRDLYERRAPATMAELYALAGEAPRSLPDRGTPGDDTT